MMNKKVDAFKKRWIKFLNKKQSTKNQATIKDRAYNRSSNILSLTLLLKK